MNSKVIERPTTATGARAKLKATITPQSIVNDVARRIKELEAMFDVACAVNDPCQCETVLMYASGDAERAAALFQECDTSSDYGYCDLLNMESLAAAAAALAQQEADAGLKSLGRAISIRAIATAATELTTIFDANQNAIDEWMKAQTGPANTTENAAPATEPGAAAVPAWEAAGWVDIALATLQTRLEAIGSNVAYGLRTLMEVTKQKVEAYASGDLENDDTFSEATCALGIAIDSLNKFNDDAVDDLVLYAVTLSLEKANVLLLGTVPKQ